ncbi:hypothetical protein [Aquimarina longa]|uniref:hypothetical protein n=1 Tax=Aquimarina longa TaxID=1080221 RepID=UPI000B0C1F50|nr:hypothetical protein [Aquimarina longa]
MKSKRVPHISLNLPKKLDFKNLQLIDEQLEMVSGGETITLGILLGIEFAALVCGVGYMADM